MCVRRVDVDAVELRKKRLGVAKLRVRTWGGAKNANEKGETVMRAKRKIETIGSYAEGVSQNGFVLGNGDVV